MANTKQAKKMVRKIRRRTQYNKWWKGQIAGAIKSLDAIISAPEKDESAIRDNFQKFQKVVDKASEKGVIHRNKGARLKSRMAAKVTELISKN
jgi:small subunit ribosomal protein S20